MGAFAHVQSCIFLCCADASLVERTSSSVSDPTTFAQQVQSFHDSIAVDVGVTALTDLCDGVFLAKIMHKMYVSLSNVLSLAQCAQHLD